MYWSWAAWASAMRLGSSALALGGGSPLPTILSAAVPVQPAARRENLAAALGFGRGKWREGVKGRGDVSGRRMDRGVSTRVDCEPFFL